MPELGTTHGEIDFSVVKCYRKRMVILSGLPSYHSDLTPDLYNSFIPLQTWEV